MPSAYPDDKTSYLYCRTVESGSVTVEYTIEYCRVRLKVLVNSSCLAGCEQDSFRKRVRWAITPPLSTFLVYLVLFTHILFCLNVALLPIPFILRISSLNPWCWIAILPLAITNFRFTRSLLSHLRIVEHIGWMLCNTAHFSSSIALPKSLFHSVIYWTCLPNCWRFQTSWYYSAIFRDPRSLRLYTIMGDKDNKTSLIL